MNIVISVENIAQLLVLAGFLLFALAVLVRAVIMLAWCRLFGHRHRSREYPMDRCTRCGTWSATS